MRAGITTLSLAALLAFALTGCGLKGDLYLDEEPAVETPADDAVVPPVDSTDDAGDDSDDDSDDKPAGAE